MLVFSRIHVMYWFSRNRERSNEKMILYYPIKFFTNLDMWHWCHLLPTCYHHRTSTWSLPTWHWPQLQVMQGSLLPFHFVSRLQFHLWSCWWSSQPVPHAREETLSLRRLSWRSADPRSTFLPPTCCWRVQSILFIWISLDHGCKCPMVKWGPIWNLYKSFLDM